MHPVVLTKLGLGHYQSSGTDLCNWLPRLYVSKQHAEGARSLRLQVLEDIVKEGVRAGWSGLRVDW